MSGFLVAGNSQQVILNTRGERIVVYPDGSWRYYERADSVLMKGTLLKEDVMPQDVKNPSVFDKTSANTTTDQDISSLATRFSDRVGSATAEARKKLTKSLEEKFQAEAQLDQAQENKKLIEPDILAEHEENFEKALTRVKEDRNKLRWLEKMYGQTQDMLKLPVNKKPRVLNKLVAEFDAFQGQSGASVSSSLVAASPQSQAASETPTTVKRSRSPKTSDEKLTIFTGEYVRAEAPCGLIYPASGARNSVAVEKQVLFTHTDEELRPYFRQQELVTCYGALQQVEDNLYFVLEFHIASSDARKNFGALEHNSMLRLKLLGGAFVNLFNAHADQGHIDAYTGNTIYTGNYPIDKSTFGTLERAELDKIRVVWTTGFEDYDVVDIDFLINQFACLKSSETEH